VPLRSFLSQPDRLRIFRPFFERSDSPSEMTDHRQSAIVIDRDRDLKAVVEQRQLRSGKLL
jgi:hypothetical protein